MTFLRLAAAIVALFASFSLAFAAASKVSTNDGTWKSPGAIPITWYGAIGDDASDNCTALTAAVASGAKALLIPPGIFRTSCAITPAAGQQITGTAKRQSIIKIGFSGNLFVVSNVDVVLSNFSITSATPRTSGCYIYATNNVMVSDIVADNYYCFADNEGASSVARINTKYSNIHTFSPTTTATSAGGWCIKWQNYTSVYASNILCSGYAGVAQPSYGLIIADGDTFIGTGLHIVGHGLNLRISPTAGNFAGAVQIANSLFDSAYTTANVAIDPPSTANVVGTMFANVEIGNSTGTGNHGLILDGSAGTVDGFACSNCRFEHNTGSGAYLIGANAKNIHINGGWSAGNTLAGISVGSVSNATISGLKIGPAGGWGGNGNGGIDILGGTTPVNLVIAGNVVTGNTNYQIGNFSSTTTTKISGNSGYNPVGVTAAATTCASPCTVTNGPSPSTYYFRQSATNTATITQGGQQTAALANASTYYPIELGPNESVVVTWATTAPTYTICTH